MEDDGDIPKTLVKLRRTPSDTPRPASTPPVIAASGIQDEDDEERIIAELEVSSGGTRSLQLIQFCCHVSCVHVSLPQSSIRPRITDI